MDRQKEALQLAEDLLADIELKQLTAAEITLKASRLARLVGDDNLQQFTTLELQGYPTDGSADRWASSADRWEGTTKDGKRQLYFVPITRITALLDGQTAAIEAFRGGGNYSGEWASIAGREHDQKIASVSLTMAAMAAICGAVTTTIYGLVVGIYHELLFSHLQATLFAEAQTAVDGRLASASGSALEKIERVSERLRAGDAESISHALTTCRRLIDSCADHVFPAQAEDYVVDGQPLKVGASHVLNRLQAHCASLRLPKGRRDRMRRTFSSLYDRCSAGTHGDVEEHEARYVFLQTYVALGELLTLNPSC